MKKYVILIIAALATLLAACANPQADPQPLQTTIVKGSSPARCRVTNLLATPEAATKALYPPPSESDWSKGPDNALVTFMEYSDFQ